MMTKCLWYLQLYVIIMDDLLRNGPSYCFGLNTQYSFQETQPWVSSPALLCATFISLFIYFTSPYWANSRDYKIPLCNSVLPLIHRCHFEIQWHKLHQQSSSLISLISDRKSPKNLPTSSCIACKHNMDVRITTKCIISQPVSMVMPIWTSGRPGLTFCISLEEQVWA